MNIFRPSLIIDRFNHFDINQYQEKGFKLILLDIDNTIAKPDIELTASKEAIDFINDLKKHNFKVIFFSNNTYQRVKQYADSCNCDFVFFALKPFPFSYLFVKLKYRVKFCEIVSLGDQLLTDGIGCNLLNIHFVYTKKLVDKDSFLTSINRVVENFIFKYILHEKV